MSETRRRVSLNQLLHLWEFLNEHREIAVGFNKSTQAREHAKRMWERVALQLNSTGEGAIKLPSDWSKYWVDLKAKLKKKNRTIIDTQRRTGGGPPLSEAAQLSDIERKFLSILGEDYGSGLPGVQVDPQVPRETNQDSTSTEEPIYLVVPTSEVQEYQNEIVGSQPHLSSPVDPPTTEHRPGPSGLGPRRVSRPASPFGPGPSRPSLSGLGPRRESRPASPSGAGPSGLGRSRRRRRQASISAADARTRLVLAAERRAEAEQSNSRSIARAVDILGNIDTVLQNILAGLGAAARGAPQDPA